MNPTAEQIAANYDFPRVFEPALKTLLTLREIKAFTSQMTISTGDDAADQALLDQGWEIIDFQKDRPRAEIFFSPGAGQGQFRPLTLNGVELPVETSWSGQFKLDVFTTDDIKIHSAFVTALRFIMHTQLLCLNGNQLTMHRIQVDPRDAGTTPVLAPEKGVFQTTMLTDLDFSIQDDAWATLGQ
jgi:hypothetical protein